MCHTVGTACQCHCFSVAGTTALWPCLESCWHQDVIIDFCQYFSRLVLWNYHLNCLDFSVSQLTPSDTIACCPLLLGSSIGFSNIENGTAVRTLFTSNYFSICPTSLSSSRFHLRMVQMMCAFRLPACCSSKFSFLPSSVGKVALVFIPWTVSHSTNCAFSSLFCLYNSILSISSFHVADLSDAKSVVSYFLGCSAPQTFPTEVQY